MNQYVTDELKESIRARIATIPGFPVPSVSFTDITPVLEHDPAAFRALVQELCAPHRAQPPDAVLLVESFGYLFGAPLAYELGCRLVLARKEGGLPRRKLRQVYGMGYDPNQRVLEMHQDALGPGDRVLIVDDILATGGTAWAAYELARQAGAEVIGMSFAFELRRFRERARGWFEIRRVPVYTVVQL
jgi:adenine phosphoribosyltransferase